MTSAIDQDRRRIVAAGAATLAAAALPKARAAGSPYGPLKQVHAGVLDVGYAEAGPATGKPVVLLHGWPYDIHTYADVAPLLASAGFRAIIPHLRGHGTTHFLSQKTPRNGQQAAIATDVLYLMDALGIDKAILAGCDWG